MRPSLLLATALTFAASPAVAPAQRFDHGFDRERLRRDDAHLQEQVDSNRIAGAVGLVLRDGDVVYERAVG